jgi:hypothetical protein
VKVFLARAAFTRKSTHNLNKTLAATTNQPSASNHYRYIMFPTASPVASCHCVTPKGADPHSFVIEYVALTCYCPVLGPIQLGLTSKRCTNNYGGTPFHSSGPMSPRISNQQSYSGSGPTSTFDLWQCQERSLFLPDKLYHYCHLNSGPNASQLQAPSMLICHLSIGTHVVNAFSAFQIECQGGNLEL